MATEEYETLIEHLIPVNQSANSTMPHEGNMSQMSHQQMPSQQMSPQQMPPQQMPPQQMPPQSKRSKLFERFKNLDLGDSIQTIIIIVILFVIFSNNYFKQICRAMPFLCISDGEFNIQSLIILGFIFGVCFIFIKNYVI